MIYSAGGGVHISRNFFAAFLEKNVDLYTLYMYNVCILLAGYGLWDWGKPFWGDMKFNEKED